MYKTLKPCGSSPGYFLTIYEGFVLLVGITEVINMKNLKGQLHLHSRAKRFLFHDYNKNNMQ